MGFYSMNLHNKSNEKKKFSAISLEVWKQGKNISALIWDMKVCQNCDKDMMLSEIELIVTIWQTIEEGLLFSRASGCV